MRRQYDLTHRLRQLKLTLVTTDLSKAAGSAHPAVGLRAVASLRRLAEQLESLHVDRARDLGWSWAQIAAELGVSKQAVHQKHGSRVGKS
ncbi:MAG: helix-turn-helix domain-containing protein [Candidatus Nanopelagicales bacterium]